MVLVLCFFRHGVVKRVLGAAYAHVEILVASGARSTAYAASPGGVFSCLDPTDLGLTDEHYTFLALPTTLSEDDMVMRTCDACSQSYIPYNRWDTALTTLLPARWTSEVDLFHAPTLHAAQAVVLILRECLDQGSPILRALQGVNSRSVKAAQLAVHLRGVGYVVNHESVGNLMGGARLPADFACQFV